MSKEVLIETIQKHNPTAAQAFLMRFSAPALERYLSHLVHLTQPRAVCWIRTFETPAIVAHTRGERE